MLVEGIVAGAAHVLSGPDHLAGVAPLVAGGERMRPAWIGVAWGLGHALGVGLLGALAQTVLIFAAVEVASMWAEGLVAVVLVALGVQAVRRGRALDLPPSATIELPARGGAPDRAAFGVGVLHGLAGASHFWAVLPSLAMAPAAAAIYIGGYAVATVGMMAAFGAAVGRLSMAFGDRGVPRLVVAIGLLSIAVGVWWAVGFWIRISN